MSTARRLGDSAYLAFFPLVLNAISVVATAFIIRSLGPEGYGAWAVGASLAGSLAFFTGLGLRTLFVRDAAADPVGAAGKVAEQLGLRLTLGGGAAILAVGVGVALGYRGVILACVGFAGLGVILSAAWNVFADLIQARQQYRPFAIVTFVAGILVTLATVFAVAAGGGPISLAAAYVVNPVVMVVLLARMARTPGYSFTPRWDTARFKALLMETRALAALDFATVIRGQIDQVVAPKMMGVAGYGYYQAGTLPATRLIVVPDGLATASYAMISRAHAIDGAPAAQREIRTLIRLTLLLCAPVAIGIFSLAGIIAGILFPDKSEEAARIMRITILAFPLDGLNLALRQGMQAVGRHVEAAKAGLRAVVFTGITTVALIWKFGLPGAAVAYAIRQMLVALSNRRPANEGFPEALRPSVARPVLLASGAMIGVMLALGALLPPGWVGTLIAAAFGGIAYLVALVLLGEVPLRRSIEALKGLLSPAA